MSDTLLGQVIDGRYRLLEILFDAGPRGVVYVARHEKLDRRFAVKVFRTPASPRFEEAARKLSCIRHPNVEPIHDYGRLTDGRAYVVTELLAGESLAERMERPFEQLDVLSILEDACAGLAEVHAADLVHGSIKPENLFFEAHRSGETLKLLDFDLDVSRASHSFIDDAALAAAAWIAPEQAKGRSAEPASDLYALGAIAYACLAGHPPYEGEAHSVLSKKRSVDPTPLCDLPSRVEVDPEVEALVLSLLEREPYDRPESASSVAEQVAALHGELGGPALPQSIRARVPWFGVAATITAAAALSVVGMRAPDGVRPIVSTTGSIALESVPSGAEIYLDGQPLLTVDGERAVTPADVRSLQYGQTYRVELRFPGRVSWESEIPMCDSTDGHTYAPTLMSLSAPHTGLVHPARLTVTGDPHADVYLDHQRIGSPPLVDVSLLGDHQLTIKSMTEVRTLMLEAEPGDSIRYHVR